MKLKELLLRRRTLMIALLLLLVGALAVWGPLSKPGISAGDKGGDPKKEKVRPVTVSLAPVQLADIPLIQQAIGNVEALENVSIQPQISGQLTKIHFSQGAFVHKGQLLFELDSRLQAANLSQLEALLSRSQAMVRQAKANLTKIMLKDVQSNIEQFRLQYNSLPSSLEDLTRCSEKTGPGCIPMARLEQLKDSWGNQFAYALENGGRAYRIKSFGADGRDGGEGVNYDITVSGP